MNPAFLTLFAVLLLPMISTAQISILAGPITNSANGHFYYLLSSASWSNSEAHAVSLGGHLVTINDAAENAWVAQTFARFGRKDCPLWIGLTDRASEGKFDWVSNERADFLNWNTQTGEPNNSAGSGYEEDFTYMIEANAGNSMLIPGQWNDAPNDGYGVARSVCGVVEVVPAPASAPTKPRLLVIALGILLVATGLVFFFLVKTLRRDGAMPTA